MLGSNQKKTLCAFALGAAGYPLLELLWRGRTHVSMALAGGVCFALVERVHAAPKPLLRRCLTGALAITGVELACGLVVNRLLRLGVWDYSRRPLNLWGQICPLYSALWFGLCLLVSPLCRALRLYFSRERVYNQENGTQRGEADACADPGD